jgi:hypothetical protein
MDPELGQLPPEVKELLDAYLEAAPAARAEAEAAARAAAMIALAALAGGLGYRLGQANAPREKAVNNRPHRRPSVPGTVDAVSSRLRRAARHVRDRARMRKTKP